jgi:hypothetical protein
MFWTESTRGSILLPPHTDRHQRIPEEFHGSTIDVVKGYLPVAAPA